MFEGKIESANGILTLDMIKETCEKLKETSHRDSPDLILSPRVHQQLIDIAEKERFFGSLRKLGVI